jgi:ferredoxin-NADP reductase
MATEYEASVGRIVEHAPGTRSLFLRGVRLQYRPGQFLSCLLPVGGETLIRPYSIVSDPGDDDLEICLNRVAGGLGSAYLLALAVGSAVRFTGPWGTFVLDRAPEAETVFIADGTGVAPTLPMIRRAVTTVSGHPLRLLHAAGDGDVFLYRAELDDLARREPALTVERVRSAALEAEVARRWIDADGDRTRRFYVCGVGAIVPRLRDMLRGAGYQRRAVQYEKW